MLESTQHAGEYISLIHLSQSTQKPGIRRRGGMVFRTREMVPQPCSGVSNVGATGLMVHVGEHSTVHQTSRPLCTPGSLTLDEPKLPDGRALEST